MPAFTAENKLAVYSSYVASYEIAKLKKAHTIGEDLLMSAMKKFAKIMIGEKESKKLNAVSLSNNTWKRHIVDMSDDVLKQILSQVKESPIYSIQLDKSTDIAHLPQLSVVIRYIYNADVSKDLLFCKALKLHTKGKALAFLHDKGIAHRDLKPANILCETADKVFVYPWEIFYIFVISAGFMVDLSCAFVLSGVSCENL